MHKLGPVVSVYLRVCLRIPKATGRWALSVLGGVALQCRRCGLHGNIKLAVANVSGLSNILLAREEVQAAAKRHGYG